MSYSLSTQCWNCKKQSECKDAARIQKGIDECHASPEDHKGSGSVIIQCVMMEHK